LLTTLCVFMAIKIAIVMNIVPQYRKDFYRRIMTSKSLHCVLFCQREIRGSTISSVHTELPGEVVELSYFALPPEKLVWQRLPIRYLWRQFDIYVFNGNPRFLSTLIWATALRLARRKVIIWGQVHTAGASMLQERIRLSWWKLFDYFFVYTDSEVQRLKQRGFKTKTIVGMNNGLDQHSHELQMRHWQGQRLDAWKKNEGLEGRRIILSCARLETKNRFDLMIQCMPALTEKFNDITWCIIGDGSMATALKKQAERSGAERHISWLGAIYDEEDLAPWFMVSECLVHPGAIGLSLLHAFGYGLPVITHDNVRNQMPEIAALKNGWNGLLYRENDPGALLERIIELLQDDLRLNQMRDNALNVATTEFNTQIMASRFAELIQAAGSADA